VYPSGFLSRHPDAWEEPYPAVALYAHRNVARWVSHTDAADLARMNGVSRAVVFTISDAGDAVTGVRHLSFE
jgi:hypothetical protein